MCPQGREHIKQEIEYEISLLLLYQMIDTSYSIDLNMPYRFVECQYVVLSLQNTPYCLEEQDTLFRLQKSIRCMSRRFDTSYLTGGYAISGNLPEQSTLKSIK
ncbi:hypothetical protein Tco_0813167 [Tanacetum coccineum]